MTMTAKAMVTRFAIQPIIPGIRNARRPGKNWDDLFLASSRAAGMAKVTCCRMTPVPMKALNAVEEPK
jgi:hypothetical protein